MVRLGLGGRAFDDGVDGDGAVAADDDRVDIDGDDLGVGKTDVGDGDQCARDRVDVERSPRASLIMRPTWLSLSSRCAPSRSSAPT